MYDTYWDNSTDDFIDRRIDNRSIKDLFPTRRACAAGIFDDDYQRFLDHCKDGKNSTYTPATNRLSDKCFRHGPQQSVCDRDPDCTWNATRCELKNPIVWNCSDAAPWPSMD